ncbi:uncharacterized protein [Periplaneta americana]|uniref:uncharacterized protein n=1 Tax=Periplaneta americana TaxID=6978 RepID=UPI0037E7D322
MTRILSGICILLAVQAISLPLVRSEEVYNATKSVLNFTETALEKGVNISEPVLNATVLFACEAMQIFLDKGVFAALKQLRAGNGSSYPYMQQCVDGCLYFLTSSVVRPIASVLSFLNPIKLPKSKSSKVYNSCYKSVSTKRDKCNLINNMKRCLLNELPNLSNFIVRHIDRWIEAAKKALGLNLSIFPIINPVERTSYIPTTSTTEIP